jgi:CheY-like chemotaxis protein
MRILLIEDDTTLGAAVRDQIAADGQSVDWVTRLDAAGDAVRAASYDLILLDLMLPDGRGIGFLKSLRARGGSARSRGATAATRTPSSPTARWRSTLPRAASTRTGNPCS